VRQIEITENTKVPLSALFSLLAIFCTLGVGGIFWISTLYSDVAQAKRDIIEAKADNKETQMSVRRIEAGVQQIKYKLGIKSED
jgi:hypothetical protein